MAPPDGVVVSLDDPRVAPYRGMRDPVIRNELGCFIAEGPDVVRQAVDLGYEIVSALIDARHPGPALPDRCEVLAADPKVIGQITGLGVHRGVLALVRRPPMRSVESVAESARRLVLLEEVENPVNVGLIARSVAGLGMDGLVVDGTSGDPLYRRAVTASRGATLRLPWARVASVQEFLDGPGAAMTSIALTPDATAADLRTISFEPDQPAVVLLGSEGPGLSADTMARCTIRARLPMSSGVDSLNVAMAAAIACWELGRS